MGLTYLVIDIVVIGTRQRDKNAIKKQGPKNWEPENGLELHLDIRNSTA